MWTLPSAEAAVYHSPAITAAVVVLVVAMVPAEAVVPAVGKTKIRGSSDASSYLLLNNLQSCGIDVTRVPGGLVELAYSTCQGDIPRAHQAARDGATLLTCHFDIA